MSGEQNYPPGYIPPKACPCDALVDLRNRVNEMEKSKIEDAKERGEILTKLDSALNLLKEMKNSQSNFATKEDASLTDAKIDAHIEGHTTEIKNSLSGRKAFWAGIISGSIVGIIVTVVGYFLMLGVK